MTNLIDNKMQQRAVAGPQQKILIVEDDAGLQLLMQVHLEQAGYSVTSVMGAHHALLNAEWFHPDLILLDIMLPGPIDGWGILAQLKAREKTASIPVIIVSACIDEARMKQATGVEDYLIKPFNVAELILRVQHTLASHSPIED